MIDGLPLGDPQFWAVTGAALAAIALLVLRRLRRRRQGLSGPECCPGCGECGRPRAGDAASPRQ